MALFKPRELFTSKNLTPNTLSLLAAFVFSLLNALLSLFLVQNVFVILLIFSITFVVAYTLYYFTIHRFVYRKLKLIYKLIYKTKATRKEEIFNKYILPQKSIDEVSTDVEKWASKNTEQIQLLKQNEAYRREFLMNLAHELRTPIFAIQGYVDTLINGALEDPEVNRRFLVNASKGIDRLVKLVDDVDVISRLESGAVPLIQEPFIIQELIEDAYEELALKAKDRNMQLTYKVGTENSLWVIADMDKIKQVLINLIDNAIKYGKEDGIITAGCYIVEDTSVLVEISDDGPGIAEEHISRVFERFYRADRSRARSIGGTGLGLAIVKHIVEAHGGNVFARSTPNVGSTFGFTLRSAKKIV